MISTWLVLLGLLSPSPSASPTVSFSELQDGDTLWVTFESGGCFHGYRAELTLLGREPSTMHVKFWNLTLASSPKEPEARTVKLTRTDRSGLDRLVAYYKTKPPGGCTTVDRISLSMSRKGRRSSPLNFTDGSCHQFRRSERVVTLHEVIFRR